MFISLLDKYFLRGTLRPKQQRELSWHLAKKISSYPRLSYDQLPTHAPSFSKIFYAETKSLPCRRLAPLLVVKLCEPTLHYVTLPQVLV
jgi:hypothetical protein